jgi:hypothetical protein
MANRGSHGDDPAFAVGRDDHIPIAAKRHFNRSGCLAMTRLPRGTALMGIVINLSRSNPARRGSVARTAFYRLASLQSIAYNQFITVGLGVYLPLG